MDPQTWGAAVLVIVAVAGAVALLFRVMSKTYGEIIERLRKQNADQQEQIDRTVEKADIAWEFQMRRANVEAKLAERAMPAASVCESPDVIRIPPPVYQVLRGIAPRLQEFYRRLPPELVDTDVMLHLEKGFGDWLVNHLCIPFKQSHGECLIYAMIVAKETE